MTTPDFPFRLGSYNIRAGLGSDLRRRPDRVLNAIADLSAHVVVLQEADFRLGDRPTALPHDEIQKRTGLIPQPVAENDVSLGWHGIAMLAAPGFETRDVHRFDLPGLEPRGAIVVDFDVVRVVGVHLGLLRRSRRTQLDFIRDVLGDLNDMPTVIVGDFNEWSQKVGLGRLARAYEIVTPQKTFPSSLPLAPLDRIAHSDDLRVTPLTPPKRSKGPKPSDHLPILAEVTRASSAD